MSWKTAYRSFYYANAEEPADIALDPATTALLVIDVQDVYLAPKDTPAGDGALAALLRPHAADGDPQHREA